MLIDEEISPFKSSKPHAVSIGVFDGVHKGHKYFLSKLLSESIRSKTISTVITFKNNPLSLLNPNIQLENIISVDDRIQMIKNLGIKSVIPISFDQSLSQ